MSDYNLANIEKTAYSFGILTEREEERSKRHEQALIRKYAFLIAEFDKVPLYEETRWEMIWKILRISYKLVKTLYYILKILDLFQTLKEIKDMTKDKLTTVIGAIIGAILTVATVWFGFTIPAEVATVIIGFITAIAFWIWKPKEKDAK